MVDAPQAIATNVAASKLTITRVDPLNPKGPGKNEATGNVVTVTGTGFGAKQGSSLLLLRNKAVKAVSWSDTELVATVTRDGGPNTVQVSVGSQTVEAPLG